MVGGTHVQCQISGTTKAVMGIVQNQEFFGTNLDPSFRSRRVGEVGKIGTAGEAEHSATPSAIDATAAAIMLRVRFSFVVTKRI